MKMKMKMKMKMEMEQSMIFGAFLLIYLSTTHAYKNYTVGESLGWYDSLENPNINYQNWVSSKPQFTLGDFLLFNTDTNHSVVQTYNLTTYEDCNYDDALDTDTVQWSSSDPSYTSPTPVFIAVPLVRQGLTYFFSSDYDGEQCQNGQRFKVNVTHGQGLPRTLAPPSQDISPSPAASVSENEDSVPAGFLDHPRHRNSSTNNDGDDLDDDSNTQTSGAAEFAPRFHGVFIFFVFFICLF